MFRFFFLKKVQIVDEDKEELYVITTLSAARENIFLAKFYLSAAVGFASASSITLPDFPLLLCVCCTYRSEEEAGAQAGRTVLEGSEDKNRL